MSQISAAAAPFPTPVSTSGKGERATATHNPFYQSAHDLGANTRPNLPNPPSSAIIPSHDNGKEYNCKIEGQKMLEPGKNDMPSTASSSATRHLNP